MRSAVQTLHRSLNRLIHRAQRGQALVEFSLAVVPFLILLMGIFDLGRGIYMMNGTSEAAREITRVTIVHLKDGSGNLGFSTDTTDVIATQRNLIPGLTVAAATDITCVDAYDQVQADADCSPGTGLFIKVRVTAPFEPITPIVAIFGSHTFESTSRMQIP
jgi:Flp pilus assembly protein TadG